MKKEGDMWGVQCYADQWSVGVSRALRAGTRLVAASLFFGGVTVGVPQGLLEWDHCLGPISGAQETLPLGSR